MPKKKPEKSLEQMLEEALVKEDERPYVVPRNWEWVKFDTALLNVTSSQKKLKQKKYSGIGNIPVVDQGAKLIGGYTTQKDLQYNGELPVIIFGDHTRIVKFIDFVFVQGADGIKVLLPRQIFVPEFIYYFLKNLYIPGMGYRRHFKFLRDASFSLPPLLEQKRIVKKLSSMLGKLKEARELILEAKETFEERRAAILNKAFTGELTKKWRDENPDVDSAEKLIKILITEKKKQGKKGEIPTYEEMIIEEGEQPYEVPGNWGWTRPTSLAEQLRGVTYKKKDAGGQPEEGKSLILRAGNLQEGEFITDHDCVYVANDLISNIQQLIVGDVVVAASSGSKSIVGKAAQVKKEMPNTSFGAFLTLFRPNTIINSKYYGWFFQSKYYRDKISMLSAGININNIKREHFESLYFPLPPLSEQKKIVQILDKLLDHENGARELINMEQQINLLEKSILLKAFRGELGTNDPNDEPAIELLKRSLKEKPKAAKKQDK